MLHCPVVSVLYSTLFTDMELVCYIVLLLVCYVHLIYRHGVSVLHCAVANNHEDVVKALLEGRARGHQFGLRTHRSPIFLAVGLENATMTRMLLQHGARINHRDGFGEW